MYWGELIGSGEMVRTGDWLTGSVKASPLDNGGNLAMGLKKASPLVGGCERGLSIGWSV